MDEWHLFTNDILNAGKLTPQEDYAAWSTGVVTGVLTSPLILVFGPVAGYYAGKSVHKKVVVSRVKERLLQDGDMRSVLRRWNERSFAGKGFQVWLELPVEGDQVSVEPKIQQTKVEKKAAKKENRRFKIVIIPHNGKREDSWSSTGSPTPPAPRAAVPFVEAPTTEHAVPVEMETGSPDYIQPLVNHQVAIAPDGDTKYEYRPVPPEIRPDCDVSSSQEVMAQGSSTLSGNVANGRIPISEIIPLEDKKDKNIDYPIDSFEMDGGHSLFTKQG